MTKPNDVNEAPVHGIVPRLLKSGTKIEVPRDVAVCWFCQCTIKVELWENCNGCIPSAGWHCTGCEFVKHDLERYIAISAVRVCAENRKVTQAVSQWIDEMRFRIFGWYDVANDRHESVAKYAAINCERCGERTWDDPETECYCKRNDYVKELRGTACASDRGD